MVLAVLFLAGGLWSPMTAIPEGVVLASGAWGIPRRRRWSAYGGALFLATMLAAAVIALLRAGSPLMSVATTTLFFGSAALVLYGAGRALPADRPPRSMAFWIVAAGAVIALPLLFRPYIVAAGSMQDTILPGDHILVRPVGGISRGGIYQVRHPAKPTNLLLKRVVAIGGDRVRIENQALFVNGSR